MPVVAFGPSHLRALYEATKAVGHLGGSDRLWALERAGWRAFDSAKGHQRIICFMLASLFKALAEHLDGEPVDEADATQILNILDQPIMACLDCLSTSGPDGMMLNSLSAL